MGQYSESKTKIILYYGQKNGKTCFFIKDKLFKTPKPVRPKDLLDTLRDIIIKRECKHIWNFVNGVKGGLDFVDKTCQKCGHKSRDYKIGGSWIQEA